MQISKWYRLTIISLLLLIVGCNEGNKQGSSTGTTEKRREVDSNNSMTAKPVLTGGTTVLKVNQTILEILKSQNLSALFQHIHPERGIRFSPYGFIDTVKHKHFTSAQFKAAIQGIEKIKWGQYDGSGEEILLNCKDYFTRFVYNKDFLNAEKKSFNNTIGRGNSLNNLAAVYPGLPFVENYFSGFEKKYEGMDWCSLTLVFAKWEQTYYLVGMVHDQWTI